MKPIQHLATLPKRLAHTFLALCLAAPCIPAFAEELEDTAAADATVDVPRVMDIEEEIVRAVEVRYVGPRTIDRERILGMISTRVGAPLSVETTERDIRTLVESGEVDNARFLSEPMAGGVRVIVVVSTRAALGGLSFVGNEEITSRRLARQVPLAVGDTVSELRLLEGKQKIEELYRKRGFAEVEVAYRLSGVDDEGFQRVVFEIQEGPKMIVRRIRFEGTDAISAREVRRDLEVKERSWITWLTRSNRIEGGQLLADRATVERAVQDQGFMNARVVDVRAEPVGDRHVDLVYVVEQGRAYEIAEVKVSGMRIFEPERISAEFELRAGQPYSATAIAEDVRLIRDYYGSEGYADSRVDPVIRPAGEGRVSVEYTVVEGPRSFVGQVNIRGNDKSRDKVIRREVTLAPGDVFNTVEVDASRRRLMGTGYFDRVDMFPTPSAEPGYRDLNITVSEQSTGQLMFGAGFSSIDNLVGYATVTQTNFDAGAPPSFQGGGQKFSMGARVGTKRKDFQIGLEEPYFMDRRLLVGAELFYRDLAFLSDDYEQRDIGGSLRVRRPFRGSEFTYIEGEYILQQVEIHDISREASDLIRAEEGTYLQHKFQLGIVHDSRDDLLVPRRGGRYSATAHVSFGDVEAHGAEITGLHYFLLPYDLIFNLQGRVATVDGSNVPIFERLFLGGANTLRGFDFRDVGPKDGRGEPIGGFTSTFFSAEMTAPLIDRVRGAVFFDAGMVSQDTFDFGGDFNSNWGFGLRLNLPMFGALAIDYGIPIKSDEFNDSSGRFNFNVGYKF